MDDLTIDTTTIFVTYDPALRQVRVDHEGVEQRIATRMLTMAKSQLDAMGDPFDDDDWTD